LNEIKTYGKKVLKNVKKIPDTVMEKFTL